MVATCNLIHGEDYDFMNTGELVCTVHEATCEITEMQTSEMKKSGKACVIAVRLYIFEGNGRKFTNY